MMDRRMIVRIVGAGLGVLLGVLMLTIGFWKALLLGLLGAAGWYLAGNTTFKDWVRTICEQFKAARSQGKDI